MGSHDGIQIVAEESAARQKSPLPRNSVTPEKVRVHLAEGDGLDILWRDGHASHWTFQWLRDACPCAMCSDTREQRGLRPGQKPPTDPLQLYKDPARPTQVTPVGRYALQFHWNDGHASGIYSWDFLRRVCRCDACRASEQK